MRSMYLCTVQTVHKEKKKIKIEITLKQNQMQIIYISVLILIEKKLFIKIFVKNY